MAEKEKIYIYGSGKRAKSYIRKISHMPWLKIIGVIDNAKEKEGSKLEGFSIISVEMVNKAFNYILIASTYQNEIKSRLMSYGIAEEKIKQDDFFHNNLIKLEYEKHYKKVNQSAPNFSLGKREKVLIYTAVFGNYDIITEPKYVDENCEYICFTDNLNLQSKVWKIIYVKGKYDSKNRSAKIYKILPHKFISGYDWTIWVDGNYILKGSMRRLLEESIQNTKMAFLVHTERNCIYDEANVCIAEKKDEPSIIEEQVYRYHKEGYPVDNGLICGSCIIRNIKDEDVKQLMEAWWEQIENNSLRDQLSFNYAAWKTGISYDLMKIHTFINPYFSVKNHIKS